jgi:hypothetical protein
VGFILVAFQSLENIGKYLVTDFELEIKYNLIFTLLQNRYTNKKQPLLTTKHYNTK